MRKRMYKVKKHWVIASTALISLIGMTAVSARADEIQTLQTVQNQQESTVLVTQAVEAESQSQLVPESEPEVEVSIPDVQFEQADPALSVDLPVADSLVASPQASTESEQNLEGESNLTETVLEESDSQQKVTDNQEVSPSLKKVSSASAGPGQAVVTVDSEISQVEGAEAPTLVSASATGEAVDRGVAMHRLYNPNSGEHFYTAHISERDFLVRVGWKYENIGWYAASKGDSVYRLYNPNAGDHHYTLSAGERDFLVKVGWRYEGVGWYSKGTAPVHRLYNPNARAGAHHFTLSAGERDFLVKVGWRYEGISWYGLENVPTVSSVPTGWKYSVENQVWQYYDDKGKIVKTAKTISAAQVTTISNSFLSTIYKGAISSLERGILPSIAAAQAVLESGWGKSTLAKAPNYNLFGIKASKDWTGDTVTIKTTEYVDGKAITVNAVFRKYKSWDESIRDHAKFFTSTEWRKKNYAAVLGELDYKKAAQALQDSGYATDPNYAKKLINIIETYNLSTWDKVYKS